MTFSCKVNMSILIKNFNGSELIPYSHENLEFQLFIVILGSIFYFFGIIFETLVIAAILRVRTKTVDTLFVLSLCVADLIFNLYMSLSNMIVLIAGGWGTGKLGCKISNTIIILGLGISILSITFITLHRYLAIIWKTNITRNQALIMIASIWFTLPLVSILYLSNNELSESSIALQPCYWYCILEFSSTDPVVITAVLTIIVLISTPIFFMSYAYAKIILYYRKMNQRKKRSRLVVPSPLPL